MIRFTRSARTSLLTLAALAALAVAVGAKRAGDVPLPARIPSGEGAGLTSKTGGLDNASSEPLRRKDLLVGDRDLRGEVDLSLREEKGDHYEVPLGGGSTAILTLDPKVQHAAEKILAKAKSPMGAIIVMHTDGRILALTGRRHGDAENELPTRENDFGLALSVWAPAASVFKIVTAAALVHAGVKPKEKICYHGGLRSVDLSNLVDSPRSDKACNDLGYGVAKSQNALIAKLANNHLNPKTLGAMASNFGFGASPKFALDAEPGRIDLPEDKLEFARVSAGFWSTELSPLGAALAANVIASKGLAVNPRIVAEVHEADRVIPVVTQVPKRVIDEEVAKSVGDMMTGTVRYGTAFKAFHDKRGRAYLGETQVAGKTGSLSRNTPSFLAYSWFVGYAPADDPQVVVAVLLGNGPLWHLKAHTAARLLLDTLY
jgi:cell division protein FtsI/penicillin-binding protein 2